MKNTIDQLKELIIKHETIDNVLIKCGNVYDDLFLCEHVPYEKHRELLHVKTKYDYDSTRELIQKIILSNEFKALNLKVIGYHTN